jgi:FkbM family methyltransferase
VLDVGAHVGVHALSAARRLRELGAGGRVVAFEPTTDSAAAIRAGAARNGLAVEVVESALGDHEGTVEIHGDPRYGDHDAGVRSQFGEGAVVQRAPVTTLDAWAAATGLDRLDVVKLDIEGAEILALRGAQETLRRLRPRLLAVEVKDVVMERGPGDEAALHALLAECGYAPAGEAERHIALFRAAR